MDSLLFIISSIICIYYHLKNIQQERCGMGGGTLYLFDRLLLLSFKIKFDGIYSIAIKLNIY